MNPILNTAMHTTDQLKHTAARTRSNFLELGVQTMKLVNDVRAQEARTFENVLSRIGLQRRENPIRPFALFFVGAAIAGGAALLLAPTSGRKARRKIGELFGAAAPKPEARPIIEMAPSALDPDSDGVATDGASRQGGASDHSRGH